MKLLTNKIICASLNYRKLDKETLKRLDSAKISNDKKSLENFKSSLGFEVESLAIIKKCNAIILVLSYQEDLSFEFISGRILTTWDSHSNVSITTFINDIKFFVDLDAIQYLAECAAGIHSVTIGDSQVLSQIKHGLTSGFHGDSGILKLISIWLEKIVNESKIKTSLFDGNTSLERIACNIIINSIKQKNKTLLFGYGKSGKLVAKILNRENSFSLDIINRSEVDIKKEKLDPKMVRYFPSKNYATTYNPRCMIIALDNTKQTDKYINTIIKDFKDSKKILFIDLSSPPLLENKVENLVCLENLSEIANENIEKRKKEIKKVKEIIADSIPEIIDQINTSFAEIYILQQKHNHIKKLDKEKIDLVIKRSQMYKTIREFLEKKSFVEVTTPYIVGISTDPPKVDKGSTIDVEWANNSTAFLRQSNQIYKQILVASGMKKIFEIGPFWRKEEKESYRHLQESIGLDIEMKDPKNTEELYYLACNIIKKIYKTLNVNAKNNNSLYFPAVKNTPVLTYSQAIKKLQENSCPIKYGEDLGLEKEAILGEIVKKNTNSDIFVIKDYPDTIKKFYTKNKGTGLTETFDIIVDGWEFVSGAIRQTDAEKIRKSMMLSGIDSSNYEFYISIVDGAISHGGFCIGLDRLLAKSIGVDNVMEATPFPRTYKRLIP